MSPTEDLIHDHEAIKVMLSIMSKIAEDIRTKNEFDAKDIEKMVEFLKTFADNCHHGKEEKALFPALIIAGVPNENGPIGVMLQEHNIGRNHIKEISSGLKNFKTGDTTSGELIASGMIAYVNLLHNHILKEENILFPMATKILSAEIQNEIINQFKDIEKEVTGRGVHKQYDELLKQLKSKYIG